MCYHTEFGRYRSNRVRISRGEPTKLGSAGFTPLEMEGVADPLKYVFPHVLPNLPYQNSVAVGRAVSE